MRSTTPGPGSELLRLAESDPARLTAQAVPVAARARAGGDLALASVAERALGVAASHLADLKTAAGHLREAIRLADLARAPEQAAQARIRLAFVHSVGGRPQYGLREIDRALPALHGPGLARAAAQRAVIFNHLHRFDEALAAYEVAIPELRRAGDGVWLQRVLSNRGVAHGYRGELAAAEADLREAERLCRDLELDLSLAIVQMNLGWVGALRGDVPDALRHLDLAEQRLRLLGTHQLAWLLADRSELLLSVGLLDEARQTAQAAVAEFRRRRRGLGLPEARLLLARVAHLQGDDALSIREARSAAAAFTRQHRPEWASLARYVILIGRERSDAVSRPLRMAGALERSAAALDTAGWPMPAVEARLRAARLALAAGATRRACRQLEQAARGRHRGPAIMRARAWHAQALLRLAQGNRRGASSALRTALRILDEHRAALGATDLRAYSSSYRVEVAETGLRMAVRNGRADQILRWAEQGRASHLLMRPARPPDDPYLSASLAELRATVQQIRERRDQGLNITRLTHRQIALENAIRDHCRRQGAGTSAVPLPPRPMPVRELAKALGDAALVEFVQLDGTLYALSLAAGRLRFRRLGPLAAITDLIERIPFALHRLARRHTDAARREAALAMLRRTALRLDGALLRPLAAELADRPLVIVPSGPLQTLPWTVLPSCAGRTVNVAPSAALWYAAAVGERPEHGPVVAAAGPELPGARLEAETVAAVHSVPALLGPAASVGAVMSAMDGARLVHLAAHGRLHATNPLFSSLHLADGPLTVYDLERLREPPRMVILAACDSGRSVVGAGDELLGLSATFLALGTRTIIASLVPIPDAETTTLMIALHKLMASGMSAATALAQAQRQMGLEDPASAAAAAAGGFICMGADSALPPLS